MALFLGFLVGTFVTQYAILARQAHKAGGKYAQHMLRYNKVEQVMASATPSYLSYTKRYWFKRGMLATCKRYQNIW